MKAIYIKWFDASYAGHSQTLDEMTSEYIMESVGVFVKEDAKHVTFAAEFMPADNPKRWRYIHHIPKVNIIKRKFLKI